MHYVALLTSRLQFQLLMTISRATAAALPQHFSYCVFILMAHLNPPRLISHTSRQLLVHQLMLVLVKWWITQFGFQLLTWPQLLNL